MDKYFVIGCPVGHSVSPQIHNTIFKHYNAHAKYFKKRVEPRDVEAFVEEFKNNDCYGFNVTVPHKKTVMPFLDGISSEAREVNAVNTVVKKRDSGLTFGYNTDIKGFALQAKRAGCSLKGAHVKLIGAGGAARAIAYSVYREGAASLTVYNRTVENIKIITHMLRHVAYDDGVKFPVTMMSLDEFDAGDCDVLINATSVGLGIGHEEEMPVKSLEGLKPDTVVFDIIYEPSETRFLREARQRGNAAHNGLDMLIYQGVIANDIWCGLGAADNIELIDKIRKELTAKWQ